MLDVLSGVPTPQAVDEERDPKRIRLQLTFSDFKIPSFGLIDPDIQSQDPLKLTFIPAIINKCSTSWDRDMLGAAALAISRITNYAASSPDKIKYLVEAGCLWALFDMNRVYGDEILWFGLNGIQIILEAGDVVVGRRKQKPMPRHNEYAQMIDDFEEGVGWDLLIPDEEIYHCKTVVKAKKILKTYRPRLLRNDDWMRFEGQSDMEDLEEYLSVFDDDDESDDEMPGDEDDKEA